MVPPSRKVHSDVFCPVVPSGAKIKSDKTQKGPITKVPFRHRTGIERFPFHTWAVNNFIFANVPRQLRKFLHSSQLLPGLQARPELTTKELNPPLS